ncbi:MAG: hypothetical protein M3R72_07180 [Bacteroidota bacterium]|nr:hypothetical protein [Bacteroidota bacterium]
MMKVNLNDYEYDYGKDVSNPTAEENGRSFTLQNESKFLIKKWAIDKVVFKDRIDERCDYLILIHKKTEKVYYWIELKGSDIVKACEQIMNTIKQVDAEIKVHEARIISSKTPIPALRDITYAKLDNQMRKLGGCLKTYTNQGTERI